MIDLRLLGPFEASLDGRPVALPAGKPTALLARLLLDAGRGVPVATRLADLRRAAREQRIDADLELGRHEQLVGELEALVESEPLREGLRRRLMLALYRSGRQADALARYRAGRAVLVDQLGIEPGPELQELERAILRQDPLLGDARARVAPARGCVICAVPGLHALVAPLRRHGRELLLVGA